MSRLIFLLAFAISVCSNAQTVYFDNLSKSLSVGLGYSQPKFGEIQQVTFAIMQESKNKKFDDFSIKFINENGDEYLKDVKLELDTIFHFTDDDLKLHECDYTMSRFDLEKIYRQVGIRDIVIINGQEIGGSAFIGVLRGIEDEIRTPFSGFNNVQMWNWGNRNIQLMRFPGPGGRRDFRFMRRIGQ